MAAGMDVCRARGGGAVVEAFQRNGFFLQHVAWLD